MSEQFFGDPYDPAQPSEEFETPPLAEVLKLAINQVLLNTHTCLPGKVVKVRNNNYVDVQPEIQVQYQDGNLVNLPPVQNCPLGYMSGADFWIKPPVAVGDEGVIIFSERSLSSWKPSGGVQPPSSYRHHALTDGIFFPGIRPMSQVIPGDAGDMILHNGKSEIYMKKDGTFKMTNGVFELFSLIQLLMDTLINQTYTLTIFGPQPFIQYTQGILTTIQTQFLTLGGETPE